MKYTLMPYQETASDEIMNRLDEAATVRSIGQQSVFALSAPTGAGKTVIATSVFERLLLPSDDRTPDEKAVILWLSDNPDLNRQSRYRIESASSDLASRTIEIDNSFNLPTFEQGCIYFLNTQKIGKGTKLTGSGSSESQDSLFARPDGVQVTIWDTLRNTINSDEHNLYLVVDEAHRGASKQQKEKTTILRRLIEGHTPVGHTEQVPPVPVVMGISATPNAFKTMIVSMSGARMSLHDVVVPVDDVQDSGLIKDIVELRIPGEDGKSFDGVFVREAAKILSDTTQRWSQYHAEQGNEGEKVVPLMVVQMKDKATPEDMYQAIAAIRQGWPQISPNAFAHVFGEHADIQAGDTHVPYVEPQSVQDRTDISILFAKTAISTGWDCPRAEVMVSYRAAKDKAHITQVIGRMVRSPLARRIEGNDQLNSVLCILPMFDKKAATEVVQHINRDDGVDTKPPIEAVIDPETLLPVDDDALWQSFVSLPRVVAPKRSDKPISMLLNLGIELERDKLLEDGKRRAENELVAIVNGQLSRHASEVSTQREDILTVETQRLVFNYGDRGLSNSDGGHHLFADQRVIEEAYRNAYPTFSRALADLWVNDYVKRHASDDGLDEDEVLDDARLQLAALGAIDDVKDAVSAEADKAAGAWLDNARADIATLDDSRQSAYRTLREMAIEPTSEQLMKPVNRMVAPGVLDKDDNVVGYPRLDGHVLVGLDGLAPMKLNEWEAHVVSTEQARSGAVGWYRNPSRAGAESVTAVFFDDVSKAWRNMQPDFVFFREVGGVVRPSIVDPHGHHLGDALDKLKALAAYAQEHGDKFVRIESLSGDDVASLKVVDVKEEKVRHVIATATSASQVYEQVGRAYR
ncbi:DEAD/DEAH box helicase family protein [Corynebacterium suicordis]